MNIGSKTREAPQGFRAAEFLKREGRVGMVLNELRHLCPMTAKSDSICQ